MEKTIGLSCAIFLMWVGLMLLVVVGVSGCVELFTTNPILETNKQIVQANKDGLKEFGQALASCNGHNGCEVGVGMAYAGGMGKQQLMRPDTVLDWIRALSDPLDTILDHADKRGGSGGGDTGYLELKGNQNVVNVGNSAENRGNGVLNQDLRTKTKPFMDTRQWNDGEGNGTSTVEHTPPTPVAE
jgi:hypothetical protein